MEAGVPGRCVGDLDADRRLEGVTGEFEGGPTVSRGYNDPVFHHRTGPFIFHGVLPPSSRQLGELER